MQDPNPLVAGRGINILQEAGIDVIVGVMEQEAHRLNERFIHNMLTNTPFVVSKVAMTLDGKIAAANGHSQWITSSEARESVHHLRNEVDAIMVGIGTVLADNPQLTTRLPEGGKNPVRVILDTHLRLPLDAQVTETSEAQTWIITGDGVDQNKLALFKEKGVEVITVPVTNAGLDLQHALKILFEKGITDILLEGGSELNGAFLKKSLINKYLIYIAPKLLGGRNSLTPFAGKDAESMNEALNVEIHAIEHYGRDLCITAYPLKE